VADHPVKVPPELVKELRNSVPHGIRNAVVTRELWLINSAYAAGADQELEACCEWLRSKDILEPAIDALRSARRPKPPTLAEQGLAVVRQLKNLGSVVDLEGAETKQQLNVLEEAINRLAELEAQQ
jgi:uncharacterized protein involved in exopolysaccharide biosynthesis